MLRSRNPPPRKRQLKTTLFRTRRESGHRNRARRRYNQTVLRANKVVEVIEAVEVVEVAEIKAAGAVEEAEDSE